MAVPGWLTGSLHLYLQVYVETYSPRCFFSPWARRCNIFSSPGRARSFARTLPVIISCPLRERWFPVNETRGMLRVRVCVPLTVYLSFPDTRGPLDAPGISLAFPFPPTLLPSSLPISLEFRRGSIFTQIAQYTFHAADESAVYREWGITRLSFDVRGQIIMNVASTFSPLASSPTNTVFRCATKYSSTESVSFRKFFTSENSSYGPVRRSGERSTEKSTASRGLLPPPVSSIFVVIVASNTISSGYPFRHSFRVSSKALVRLSSSSACYV